MIIFRKTMLVSNYDKNYTNSDLYQFQFFFISLQSYFILLATLETISKEIQDEDDNFNLQIQYFILNQTHLIIRTTLLKLNCEKHMRQGKWQQQLILTQLQVGQCIQVIPFWSMPKKSDNDRIIQRNNKVKRRQIVWEEGKLKLLSKHATTYCKKFVRSLSSHNIISYMTFE